MSSQTQTSDRPTNPHGGTERIETVIIGAGQAVLALGYHLAKQDRPFVILEANERVGDVWRKRFDSLRLYSPARYDGLPGMAFPADQWHFPPRTRSGTTSRRTRGGSTSRCSRERQSRTSLRTATAT